MKKSDTILIWIVGGIVVLVIAAFAIALVKPKATYMADDSPEGVAFNYLFAIERGEYERAYGYLSPETKGYPESVDDFRDDIKDYSWEFSNLDSSTALDVIGTDITGSRADVTMRVTYFREGDLFDSGQSSYTFDVTLREDDNGEWKIVNADRFWVYCWSDAKGCP